MLGTLAFSLFLSWVQVSSDTFIVKSSAGEQRAKRVLEELESFRQLIGTLAFRNTELPELPIEVLLIGDDETMKELAPEYNGRKVPIAGYYQRGEDRDFIVLSGRVFPETLTSIVYHELSHYFAARGLASRPTWLNEGLAEYFAAAEIRDDEISLGEVSSDRVQLLKTSSMIPLKDFFAVDSNSAYYNESSKANIFYSEAWAFMHYMLHGEHAERFHEYFNALQKSDADLLQYLKVSERDLDIGFQNYLKLFIQRIARKTVKVSGEEWTMTIDSIPDSEAQMSMAEIFLANGKFADARRHLEMLAASTPDSTRVSYYRGILARMAGDSAAREFFVDALLDPFLGPRAAAQLVELGELDIPSVKTLLDEAAAAGTRNPAIYLALTKIYTEDLRRLEEVVRLSRKEAPGPLPIQVPQEAPPELLWQVYARGTDHNVQYRLLAESELKPETRLVVSTYYPKDLLDQKLSGEVVLDVQITEEGKVGGVWLVSAMPDIFANLATSSIRQWEFDAVPAKIRIVLEFKP